MRASHWRGLGLLLGLALLALVLRRLAADGALAAVDWSALPPGPIAGALAAALGAQLLFATSWHRLLGPREAAGWAHDAARWALSLGGKYVPGKVFHALLRLGAYRGSEPGSVVAPAYVRELLLSLGAAAAWVAWHAARSESVPAGLAWPMGALAVALPLLALPAATAPLRALLVRWPRAQAALGDASGTRLLEAWLLQLGAYGLLGLSVHALAQALAPGSDAGAGAAIAALCLGGLAGVAAFIVPAGIGVREAALAWYLAPWLGAGPAALVAVAARLVLTLAEGLALLAGLLRLRAEGRRA